MNFFFCGFERRAKSLVCVWKVFYFSFFIFHIFDGKHFWFVSDVKRSDISILDIITCFFIGYKWSPHCHPNNIPAKIFFV